MEYILWELSYAAGLRIMWCDAVSNGAVVKRVHAGLDAVSEGVKESMLDDFRKMREG